MTASADVEVDAAPACPVCGCHGTVVYRELRDLLFGAPGRWSIRAGGADGLWWLDPRPAPRELGRIYQNYYTHGTATRTQPLLRRVRALCASLVARGYGYGSSRAAAIPARLLTLAPLLGDLFALDVMWLRRRAGGRLLDVGAGAGTFLLRMRTAGWEVVGVEPDPVAASVARERFGLPVTIGTLDDVNDEVGRF